MNAVEIEEAVSDLALQPFDPAEFAFQFLAAFSARDTTLKRLRKGDSNQSDVAGGVLWRGNIHIAVARAGEVGTTLAALRASPRTTAQKAKFILATDGETVEAEDLIGGDVIACAYADLPRQFATFLPLAGISTVKEIRNNPIDVKATGRLNKLYVELLKDNPDWATEERRHELNQFMARLIFCFFAEDTGIFRENQFTATITQMSQAGHGTGDEQWGNTHAVLTELFRAMDTPVTHDGNLDPRHRIAAGIRPYADVFPYVNGGLFTGATDAPRFSRTARAYLLRAGELDWKEINPDIFGSMIQAVADDGERGELGMHYTSVPNILKVLNPLFLDDLRETLEAAGDSKQKLRNLRKRLGSIRVFDPACGSGNFLVIAYKEMRAIEAEIVAKLGGEERLKLADRRSVIPLSNFYGIEIKGFAAEIARLALLIAEFQADCLYLSQQEARAMVLPLHKTGQIRVGNALRLDWLEVCPPVRAASGAEQDLGGLTGRLALEENGLDGGSDAETFICGNPPYKGGTEQNEQQKSDTTFLLAALTDAWKSLDYVTGWFVKFSIYNRHIVSSCAFVTTNSITQGEQVARLWPIITSGGLTISFAHTSFKWRNLASDNAGVTVVVIGLARPSSKRPRIYYNEQQDGLSRREVSNINAYLIAYNNILIEAKTDPISPIGAMINGNKPADGGHLIIDWAEAQLLRAEDQRSTHFIRLFVGAADTIQGKMRYCIWIKPAEESQALSVVGIANKVAGVCAFRSSSLKPLTNTGARTPHLFQQVRQVGDEVVILVPRHSSEARPYLPVSLQPKGSIVADGAFALLNRSLWNLSLLCSKLHLTWIGAVCGRIKTDYRYSSTLGWNTFPVPKLTE